MASISMCGKHRVTEPRDWRDYVYPALAFLGFLVIALSWACEAPNGPEICGPMSQGPLVGVMGDTVSTIYMVVCR